MDNASPHMSDETTRKKIKCGDPECDATFEGTYREVWEKGGAHFMEAHPEKMKDWEGKSEEEMKEWMKEYEAKWEAAEAV